MKKIQNLNLIIKNQVSWKQKEFADDVCRKTIQLGMALANADGHMQQREIDIIKNWTKSQYGWNLF